MLFRPWMSLKKSTKLVKPCFFFVLKILKNSRKKTSTPFSLSNLQMLVISFTYFMNFPFRGGKDNHYLFFIKNNIDFFFVFLIFANYEPGL